MDYEITPQVGLGPIKFGMSSAEVREILGQPSKVQEGISKNETDHDEIKYNGKYTFEWYDENYPDGKRPQISYYENRVVIITIFKQSGPLFYKDMDLHKKKKRPDVLEALAKDEDIYYYDEEGYFFPKSGLIVPTAKNAKDLFYIMLTLTSHMMPRLEFEMYEPSTALD